MNELIGYAIYLILMFTVIVLIAIACGMLIKTVANKFFGSK
jgi:hypothetical protein